MTLNRLLHSQSDIQISNLPLLETDRDEIAIQKIQRTVVASNATHSGRKQCNAQWAQAMQRTVGASNATLSGSKQCNAQWVQAMGTTSAQLLHNICTASAQLLQNCCTTSAQLLQNFCTASAEFLQKLCRSSTQLLHSFRRTVSGKQFFRQTVFAAVSFSGEQLAFPASS